MSNTFTAMVVEETENNKFTRSIKERSINDLPKGEVLVKVHYSSLNFKDGLSASGNRGVTKNYPHTPGVDAAGVVEESSSPDFKPGDEVIVHGFDLGANTSGGFGKYIRVPASWIVRLPKNLSMKESMMYGTAGFTAAMSVYKLLENGVSPDQGEILVTGATGGVGSVAVGILATEGFDVVASTGKSEEKQFLLDLGAKEVISRDEAKDVTGKPLLKSRWAGVVDTVGGEILATAIKSTKYHGTVTCCGNVASAELNINVYPFILRAASLIGIDAANSSVAIRTPIWEKISQKWKLGFLDRLTRDVTLDNLDPEIDLILRGKQVGRVVVDLTKI